MKCSCYGEIHKRGIFMELPQSAQQAQTAPSFEGAMKEVFYETPSVCAASADSSLL